MARISLCLSAGAPSLGKVCEFSNVPKKNYGCDSIPLSVIFGYLMYLRHSNLPCWYSCMFNLFSLDQRDAPYSKVVESQAICT